MLLVLVAALTLLLQACAPPQDVTRLYELEGQVLALKQEDKEILIKHGDIKGFMPGMTMPFKVRDEALLEGVAPGDLIKAHLSVAPEDAWISMLQKTGTAPLNEVASMPAAAFVTPLKVGDPVPDTSLTDHTDNALTLGDWRGSVVALTFMYVRCPLPQFCPLLDRRFADVQRQIKADRMLEGRARLLSVSFDPDADTPARLRAHARRLRADEHVWRFATAPRDVVDRFAATFGVNVIREQDQTITHNMRTALVGPDGRVAAIYEGSEWTPDQVAADMRRALK